MWEKYNQLRWRKFRCVPLPLLSFMVEGIALRTFRSTAPAEVEVIGHLVYDLDTDGKKLQVVKYTEYSGRAVRTLYPTREALQSAWANPDTRSEVLRELTERGISFEELAASGEQPDADPFDLLCCATWPGMHRCSRAANAPSSPESRRPEFDS
ncbi:hypothetical protein GO606_011435 [Aromatoleum anaerobium]|nr:type I restriction-modification enzyme R subunit C-terminal domain-containing protein [Aromatoleum anaerobium]MCK0507482.1 hypothetical protein [Aromatoleum anaerobium]